MTFITTSGKNPIVVESGLFLVTTLFRVRVCNPSGAGLPWKIPGNRDVFCNLHFSNRASAVFTPGKVLLLEDYAIDLGLCPWVPQHSPLKGVPDPIQKCHAPNS
jgi:hypothetical protein